MKKVIRWSFAFAWVVVALLPVLLILMMFLGGCQLQERRSTLEEREKVSYAAKTTTDAARETYNNPPPPFTLKNKSPDGKGGFSEFEFTLPPYEDSRRTIVGATEGGKTSQSASWFDSTTFPLWIALIGGAIGIILLVIALRMVWRSLKNTGIGQGIALANDKLTSKIHALRSQALTEPDAQVRADLATHAADLTSIKSDLNAASPVATPVSKAP